VKHDFLVTSFDQVIDDVGCGGVATGIAKPFRAMQTLSSANISVAVTHLDDTLRTVDTAVAVALDLFDAFTLSTHLQACSMF